MTKLFTYSNISGENSHRLSIEIMRKTCNCFSRFNIQIEFDIRNILSEDMLWNYHISYSRKDIIFSEIIYCCNIVIVSFDNYSISVNSFAK